MENAAEFFNKICLICFLKILEYMQCKQTLCLHFELLYFVKYDILTYLALF